jgi:hypothetical protein
MFTPPGVDGQRISGYTWQFRTAIPFGIGRAAKRCTIFVTM